MKLFFAINEIDVDFSIYGNDTTWEGCIVDENDNVLNHHFYIKTCEMGSELYEMVQEMAEEEGIYDKIFSEDGDIINQKKYDKLEKDAGEIMKESYFDMDEEFSEYVEIEGENYTKISISDFLEHHQIGEVGDFIKEDLSGDYETKEDVEELEECCGRFFYIDDWEENWQFQEKVKEEELINLASIIYKYLSDADYSSSYVNICYEGDYTPQTEAEGENAVQEVSILIAFILLKTTSGYDTWPSFVSSIIRGVCIDHDLEYSDTDSDEFDELADDICKDIKENRTENNVNIKKLFESNKNDAFFQMNDDKMRDTISKLLEM